MRTLDNNEKNFLDDLVYRYKNGQLTCFANLIDRFLENKKVRLDHCKKDVQILLDNDFFLHCKLPLFSDHL